MKQELDKWKQSTTLLFYWLTKHLSLSPKHILSHAHTHLLFILTSKQVVSMSLIVKINCFCVNQHLRVNTWMLLDPFLHVFGYFLIFPFFFSVCNRKHKKLVLTLKIILTSKRHAEHPFAGRNRQHIFYLTLFLSLSLSLSHTHTHNQTPT